MNSLSPWVWIIILMGPQFALWFCIFAILLRMLIQRQASRRRLVSIIVLFVIIVLVRTGESAIMQPLTYPTVAMAETLQYYDFILVNKIAYRSHPPQRRDIVVFRSPWRTAHGMGDLWIKRVIGVPGDRIAIREDHLYLNGLQQSEPFVCLLQRGTGRHDRNPHVTGRYNYRFPAADRFGIKKGQSIYLDPHDPDSTNPEHYRVEPTTDTTPRVPRWDEDYLFFIRNDPWEGPEVFVPPGFLFVLGDNRNDSIDSHNFGCLNQKRVLGQAICICWPRSRMRNLTLLDH